MAHLILMETTLVACKELILSEGDWEKMRESVIQHLPEEACGLLAGVAHEAIYLVKEVLPIENVLHSGTRFRMHAHQQVNAFNYIEANSLHLVGIFHSHPKGPAFPSETDIHEAYYPECAYLIWSPLAENWQCRGFLIQKGMVQEIPIRIIPSSG